MTIESVHLGATARVPEDVLALHRMGLRFAEIPIKDPLAFLGLKDAFRDLKDELGLYYLCHGPNEGDPKDRASLEGVYLPKVLKILSIMPGLEMSLLTLHFWLDRRFMGEDLISFKIGLLGKVIRTAQDLGVSICLENLSEEASDMARALEALPSLNLTLDMGHAQLLHRRNTSFGFMNRYPERIKHIHLHDNRGGTSPNDDLHLPVGEGIIPFEGIFRKLKSVGYRGTMTLELKPVEVRRCLKRVKDLLLDA
jgi:sugar phosphate isomerase/epimerase